ncbi:LysR family transcriptional regulator [Vibrio comitans]|uniref:LysR family transcriptional regulator n=1 Tax=Vibrio comitans NBRC 102076 TaxID=1219078 RepID=A0A4Y3ILR2_9VIBR|nr:LysR family transcriptional regulator [Vibrio comitans]GEA60431.1 LysR family transcriptional regulator [Vibrio comitans NBRC 102076]
MAKERFANLDLNLLRTFLVLTQELNMRKASVRLNISQPAISQALQRLRHHFDDELFVKVRSGLEPTAYATELSNTVTPILDELAVAINGVESFSEKEIDQKLCISMNPVVEAAIGGRLFSSLAHKAPKATLEFQSWTSSAMEKILEGQTLLGVGYSNEDYKGVYSEKLIDLTGMLVAREEHLLAGKKRQVQELEGASIASLVSKGWNENRAIAVDYLKQYGVDVSVGFRSELMLPLIDVVRHSDMLLAATTLFPVSQHQGLVALNIDVAPETIQIPLYAHYHVKNRKNPLIHWLIELIKEELIQQISDNQCL